MRRGTEEVMSSSNIQKMYKNVCSYITLTVGVYQPTLGGNFKYKRTMGHIAHLNISSCIILLRNVYMNF